MRPRRGAEKQLNEIERELAGVEVGKLEAKTLEELERDARHKAERLKDDAIELGRDLQRIEGVLIKAKEFYDLINQIRDELYYRDGARLEEPQDLDLREGIRSRQEVFGLAQT